MSITLWENAFDSIEHGLDHLQKAIKTDNGFDYKRTVLDFCHATELLLKEVLYRINPIYVFEEKSLRRNCKDPLNPTLQELYSCKSLDVKGLCAAINTHVPDLTSPKSRLNLGVYSEEASHLRNKIQHFCYNVTNDEVRSILLRLSYQVLCPLFTYLDKDKEYEPLQQRLYEIFAVDEIIDHYKTELQSRGKTDYEIGVCYACGFYGLFIEYDSYGSYPVNCECVACSFKIENISGEDFHECPECSAPSLVYNEELDAGLCLWHRCPNQKDGGVVTSMTWCSKCREYKIEDNCKCTKDED